MGVVLESDSDDEEKKETKKIVEKEEEESEVRFAPLSLPYHFTLCFVNTSSLLLRGDTFEISHIRRRTTFLFVSNPDGANRAFTLFLSFSLSRSSRRKPKARTKKKKKKKKKTNNQRKRSKRKTKSQRRKRETLIRIRKTQTSSTIYPAMRSTLRSSFPVVGPLDRPGRCLRSKCTLRRTWTTSQRTKSERSFLVLIRKFFLGFSPMKTQMPRHIHSHFTLKAQTSIVIIIQKD